MHDQSAHQWERPWVEIEDTRPISPASEQTCGWIAVRARIVWAGAGEEWIDTHAFTWTRHLVPVQFSDPRYRLRGVWLDPSDFERR